MQHARVAMGPVARRVARSWPLFTASWSCTAAVCLLTATGKGWVPVFYPASAAASGSGKALRRAMKSSPDRSDRAVGYFEAPLAIA